MARIVPINEPGVLSTAFRVGGVIFTYGFPVQAVAGYFFRQYPFSPTLICGWIEK